MSKFKVGDEVIIVKEKYGHEFVIGSVVKITEVLDVTGYDQEYKAENEDDFWFVFDCEIELKDNFDYQTSNRNKLREHIKSLGFSAIDLSVSAGFNKAYFGSETGESRFNSRGDISDDRLLELKHKAFEAKKKLAPESIGKLTVGLEVKTTFTPNNDEELIKKPKSKWIASNKVLFTFVFFFVLLISLAVTGITKQVF